MALSLQRYASVHDPDLTFINLLTLRIKIEREKSKLISIAPENGCRLSENLFIEILSWLPVKELLQYKSVCKSWYAIISSPHFISKHLKNNRNNYDNCLLAQLRQCMDDPYFCELLVDDGTHVLAYQELREAPCFGAPVYGPCDGLYYTGSCFFRFLWNPAINELRYLPPVKTTHIPPANTAYSCPYELYGFGLDPVTGDYKVVLIIENWSTNEESVSYPASVVVYSLRTDSWKYCGDLTRNYDSDKNNKCYIFVKGCCFWLGLNGYEDDEIYCEVIISFDMASDSFQEMSLPNYVQPAAKSLGMYDDSLAFFSVHEDGNLDIWTFNEGIWTKKFTIGPIPDVSRPLGHLKNNKVLLMCKDMKVVLCDPKTEEIKNLAFPNLKCDGIFEYMESLVPIRDRNKSKEDVENEGKQILAIASQLSSPYASTLHS